MATRYRTIKDIPYTLAANPHPRQVLDLYVPNEPQTTTNASTPPPTPLIIHIHGGAFKFGSKESRHIPLYLLNNHDYAITAINYRRSGEALFPAMINDCKSAVRFLKSPAISSQFNIDTDRVVVWGESAGGHAAAFLGTTSRRIPGTDPYDVGDFLDISSSVVGVVDYYGPTDFLAMDDHLPKGWQTHGDVDSPESLYLGGKISEIPEKVREADPCTYVEELVKRESKGEVPKFFVAHGTKDRVVPEYMSLLLRETLERHSVDVEYLPVEGTDHVFEGISEDQKEELDRLTEAFLRKVFDK